jgi:hypothetical protein
MSSLPVRDCEAYQVDALVMTRARTHDLKARELDRVLASTWVTLGMICLAVRDNKEFQLLGFRSFDAWLEDACPRSRSVVYAALGALAELKDIPAEDLKEIPHSTAHVLKKLPRVMRADPEIIQDAKRLTTKEFSRKVKRQAPDLHLEDFVTRQFHFSETQEQVIDQAIVVVRKEYGEDISEEMALELVCVEWLQSL